MSEHLPGHIVVIAERSFEIQVPGGDAYVGVAELTTDISELDPGGEELRSERVAQIFGGAKGVR